MTSSVGPDVRARLARVAGRAPEVMVKVTGRTRDAIGLRAHLDYISRNGGLDLEDQDGARLTGRPAVKELADDWIDAALSDRRRRATTPFSLSIMLSMPAGTNPIAVRDGARAFAAEVFAGRHDYVFTLHTDTPRPHVHLSVCARAHGGERLNPKKTDLDHWRQVFAQALRDRGVEAEATPRRARGVTRKAERAPLRRIRERHEAGLGGPAQMRRSAYKDAAKAAFGGVDRPIWESRLVDRQAKVRGLYLAQAKVLALSSDPADRALGAKVTAFVQSMPQPDTQRLALARELRAVKFGLQRSPDENRRADHLPRGPDRSRN